MADQETDLSIIIEAVNNASKQLKQITKDLGLLTKEVELDGELAEKSAMSFGKLVAAVATGTVVANLATSAFHKLASAVFDIPKAFFDISLAAAGVEQVGIGMLIVANNAGITSREVLKVRDKIVEMNVTTQAANTLLRDLIRSEVDYTKALELVAATQNIASATGHSTSEAIERVSHAISSGIPWVLRDLGIKEDLNSVYERYADVIGKSTEELNQADKRTAIMNLVLREGEKYVGAYEAAMRSAAKIIGQTRDRVVEIAYQFGKVFGPALAIVTKRVKDFVESILEWAKTHKEQLVEVSRHITLWVKRAMAASRAVINGLRGVVTAIGVAVAAYTTLKVAVATYALLTSGTLIPVIIATIVKFQALAAAAWTAAAGVIAAMGPVGWAAAAVALGAVIVAIKTDFLGMTTAMKNAWGGFQETFALDIEDINIPEWQEQIKELGDEFEKLTPKQKKALKKMTEDLEKENKNYRRAVEKRAKQFEESFDDLVIAHRDAIKSLTKDLEEESKDYHEKLEDLVEDYDEAMGEIEARHERKTESIMEDMEDERKKAEEEIEKISEKYNEATTLIEREAEARLWNLKAQLDKEKALGDNADKGKIAALEQMMAYEEKGLATTMEDRKAKYDEEVGDVEEALNDKLDKLRKELEEEDTLFTEAMDKRKRQYDEDLADAKESYEEKRHALQEELDEELRIREKYADDFERLANAIAEDDLTRLLRKHNEELVEMERDHKEKLAEIKKSGFDQGLGLTEGFSRGFDAGYPAVKSRIDQMKGDMTSLARQYEDYERQITWRPGFAPWETGGGAAAGGGAPWTGIGSGGWQRGGLVTSPGIVGEAGPEIVLPLNFPKRMAQIMQAMGMSGGRSEVVQHFYVTVAGPQDVDVLMERAGFALKQGGGYR